VQLALNFHCYVAQSRLLSPISYYAKTVYCSLNRVDYEPILSVTNDYYYKLYTNFLNSLIYNFKHLQGLNYALLYLSLFYEGTT